jgi:xanthine dehydrogenase YagS FAD-binding subunit
MHPFQLSRASSVEQAIASGARYLAGGTTLVDLMKLDVETPSQLIDINRLPLATIVETPDGGLRIGATVRNSDLAHDERIKRDYAVLSEALLAGASAQLRNKATTAGNLLQRTRCVYFRDPVMACNKREPGSGCSAIDGYNRNLAILGTSSHCIASNPSDMNVALMALDAIVHIQGQGGEREVPLDDFFVLPGDTPHIEHVLQPGELITHVTLPRPVAGARSLYLKLRDRASYEFALASTAIVASTDQGAIKDIRIAMGGVGAIPWRLPEVEDFLAGKPATLASFSEAAALAMEDARPQSENGFKVELGKRCLINALITATQPA